MKKHYFKKMMVVGLLLISSVSVSAQLNVQLHYDFGKALYSGDEGSRMNLTSTVENFTADKWGSTYFFVDMDYRHDDTMSAYWEISRELKFWDAPIAAHVEFNGGLNQFAGFGNSYLIGPALNLHSKDFTKTFSAQLMYKYLAKANQKHSWQATLVWGDTFADGLCTFSGFMDLWHDNSVSGNLIFVSEPQFWLNINKIKGVDPKLNLSVGTEVELSNNFIYSDKTGTSNKFYVNPTLAVKWTF